MTHQPDRINRYVYRTFHPKLAEYIFFSSAHGIFSRIITCQATKQFSINLRRLKSYQAFLPTPTPRLEINNKKKIAKTTNTRNLNTMLLNNQWVNKDIKEKFFKNLETNQNVNTVFQNLWDTAKAVLRGKFIATDQLTSGNKKNLNERI